GAAYNLLTQFTDVGRVYGDACAMYFQMAHARTDAIGNAFGFLWGKQTAAYPVRGAVVVALLMHLRQANLDAPISINAACAIAIFIEFGFGPALCGFRIDVGDFPDIRRVACVDTCTASRRRFDFNFNQVMAQVLLKAQI